MGWWSKFLSFITPPPVKVDEVAKAKVVKAAVEDATVELESFEDAPVIKAEPKRARTKKGTYVADDKSTPDVNEAWDCLLYTSPSPRDGLLSRMPSSA